MLKFEAVRIDPSPGEIAELLADGAAAANRRCRTRLLADDPAKWRKFARQTQAAPEGFELWRGGRGGAPGTQLVGGWWTDHIGRKHVVVRGRRIEHERAKLLFFRDELARRPPLWHCYPEHLAQCWLPVPNDLPRADWIAACGCGAMATPEALGWMGATCGPCHDRREEGGSLAANRPGWLHGERSVFLALAFGRTGKYLAGIEADGTASVWDLAAGRVIRIPPPARRAVFYADLAFAGSDDERIVLNLNGGIEGLGAVTVRDWRNPEAPAVPLYGSFPGVTRVWPSRVPEHFIVASSALSLVGFDGRPTITTPVPAPFVALPNAVEPAPRFVPFVRTDGVRFIDTATLEPGPFVPYRRRSEGVYHRIAADYRENSRTAFVAQFGKLDVHDFQSDRRARSFAVDRIPVAAYHNTPAWIRSMALALDGRVLVLAVEERLVLLDAASLAPLAAFAWHVGPIECLAVSADGRTLATAGNDGTVKLWPLDRLLDGTGIEG
jgi:WD domain, G-beta repeat